MADLSKITLPSGTTYDIKDSVAREAISELSKFTEYLGVTTTELTDGATTNPITINGESVTAKKGNIAMYGNAEFIFSGTAWQEFGDLSALGDMAFVDTATGTYTPSGSVSLTSSNQTATVSKTTGDATYIPEGSVSLTNSNQTATVSKANSGDATYTPEGSVAAPTISVKTAGSTSTIHNPTKVTVAKTVAAAAPGATAPDNAITYYSVANETLTLYQIGYTTGDSITTSDVIVKTGDGAYEATAPTFTGTGARLVTGNISVPSSASFTGTGARLVTGNISVPSSATFSGTTDSVTVTPDTE